MEYKLKHSLQHEGRAPVLCTKFSPNGLRVASGSDDGRLIVWSLDNGNPLWTFSGHVAVLSLEWLVSPDGKEFIFCGYMDGSMIAIEVLPGLLDVFAFRVLTSPVECLAVRKNIIDFSFATGGCHEISVWRGEPPNIQLICNLPSPKSTVGNASRKVMLTSLHWMSESTVLATYLFHGIVVFDVVTALPSRIIQIPSIIVTACLSMDMRHIIVNDSIGGFAMYNLTNEGWPNRFDSTEQSYLKSISLGVQIIHNNQALITGSANGAVNLWDIHDRYIFGTLDHGRGVIVNCFAAHYIEQKDVFLVVTGVAYDPSAAGIRIWQTIGSIDDNAVPYQATPTATTEEIAKPNSKNKGPALVVVVMMLVIAALVSKTIL